MGGISYFTLLISVGAAAIGGLTIILFEKSMLSRIIKFNKDVKTISEKKRELDQEEDKLRILRAKVEENERNVKNWAEKVNNYLKNGIR